MKIFILILTLLPSMALAKNELPTLQEQREKNKEIFFRSHSDACERNEAMTDWLVSYDYKFKGQDIQEAASVVQNEFNQASEERSAHRIECWINALDKIHNMVSNVEDEDKREQLLQDLQMIFHGDAYDRFF